MTDNPLLDSLDRRVRARIYSGEIQKRGAEAIFPIGLSLLRIGVGLGRYLENACPYFRSCDKVDSSAKCLDYRNCPFYDGRIILDSVIEILNVDASRVAQKR